jgi:hypothetical protein
VGVTQEDLQRTCFITHRSLGQPCAGALHEEGAQDHRGDLPNRLHADLPQVGFEVIQVNAVAPHRKRTEASLLDKVVEETRDSVGERMKIATSSGRLVPGQDNREHVLHGTPNFVGHRTSRAHVLVVKGNPMFDKRVHVRRQLANTGRTSGVGKFAEREEDRDPGPDIPVLILMSGQPINVRLDLRAHP